MLGNLNDKSITEILDGPELQEIRATLKQGQTHPYCINCTDRESKGGDSERVWHNNVNEDFDIAQAGSEYQFPTIVDVRWNSTCNLSCNYCGPNDSSKWAAIKKIPVNSKTRHYYTDVCDFIEQHYDKVKEVALVGGEPLLLPENLRLLDVIPPECIVTLITNLSNPLENNEIFKKLANRRNVGWSISFDNIGDRFEYVRNGASWDLLLHNLDLVQGLMKNSGHWGGIHAVYNLYNATRLCEFKQFALERGLTIRWQNLSGPRQLDPRIFGVEVAELAAAEIELLLNSCLVDEAEQQLFSTALEHYQAQTKHKPEQLRELNTFVTRLETQYHPNSQGQFAKLWPELGKLL
jgi:MoaA/NifB/PqqE/SkfB family radical SAM enzyme